MSSDTETELPAASHEKEASAVSAVVLEDSLGASNQFTSDPLLEVEIKNSVDASLNLAAAADEEAKNTNTPPEGATPTSEENQDDANNSNATSPGISHERAVDTSRDVAVEHDSQQEEAPSELLAQQEEDMLFVPELLRKGRTSSGAISPTHEATPSSVVVFSPPDSSDDEASLHVHTSSKHASFQQQHSSLMDPSLLELQLIASDSHDEDNYDVFEDDNLPVLTSRDAQREARNFAMEHRIFLKCLLDLLAQRELSSTTTVNVNDPNILKSGPLKKAVSVVKGAWRVKYCEVRMGVLSYFDDTLLSNHTNNNDANNKSTTKSNNNDADLMRKNIRLDANTCTCRAVKLNHKSLTHTPGQAIFELTVEGLPRRFFMASSRLERSAWIRAIHDAMNGAAGGSTASGNGGGTEPNSKQKGEHSGRVLGKISRKSPYRNDLAIYLKIQKEIKNSSTKQAYGQALAAIVGKTLRVPVQWITDQMQLEGTERAFRQEGVSLGVSQLWKDLSRDTVEINTELYRGGSGHTTERIIGALSREILQTDRTSPMRPTGDFCWKGITELQALSFARDVLLSCNRTRSGGDSYYCVDALCQNQAMVVLVPSSLEAEPLSITVEHATKAPSQRELYSLNDRNGWIKTRTRQQRKWRRRFFVLSENGLNFYRHALPRPHGFLGQIKVSDTPIYVSTASVAPDKESDQGSVNSTKKYFILSIKGKEGLLERQLLFDDDEKFLVWASGIEAAISKPGSLSSPKKGVFRMLPLRDEILDARTETKVGFLLAEGSLEVHANFLGFQEETITNRAKALSLQQGGAKLPTVKVSVRATTMYSICTLDPQGVESEDTWGTIRATFLQHFNATGGPNGKMSRSEELVEIHVLDSCTDTLDGFNAQQDAAVSPRNIGRNIGRKFRRNGSAHEGVTGPPPPDSTPAESG